MILIGFREIYILMGKPMMEVISTEFTFLSPKLYRHFELIFNHLQNTSNRNQTQY